ncbi:TonB-dependent receptor [Steroidobacter agaridevorans]|uniref:TonB-dependent receptor n=1 Tax=Steroidobacter agaridevorans TaxID=2695856 RepID=A0A829YLF9_9GAMM|nr:TonB-dependent receptor [Steroidobacter agaridevorans]GFE83711.1 TonB-dependent receptor [Steroidobacter agaridevorans]
MKTITHELLASAAACLVVPVLSQAVERDSTVESSRLDEAPAARAQEVQADVRTAGVGGVDDNKRRRSRSIEEIVVTAQRREERVIDVPMAIGLLSSEEIEHKGISNMVDLSYAAPGMTVQEFGPGRQVIFLRGAANQVGTEALTSVYLDEVPASSGATHPQHIGQLDLRTTDLERVEVLKGPQGTLYGSGAVSGTVRFITADPKLGEFGAKGDVTALYTEHGDPSQRVTAVLNAPVVNDVFGLRLATAFENNGGWIDRPSTGRSDVNDNELTDVRLKSLWRVSDELAIKAMAIVHRNRDGDSGGINHSDPNGNYELPVDPSRRYRFRDDYEVYNLAATYDFSGANLLISSSYIDQDGDYLYVVKPGVETRFFGIDSLLTVGQTKERFSHEVRLASSGQNTLKWTVGAFYQDVEDHRKSLNETLIVATNRNLRFPNDTETTSASWAAFADGAYALSEAFELGAGVRYFEDDRSSNNLLVARGYQSAVFDKLTWRFNARYSVSDQASVYASVSTGFRSGGFNSIRNNVPDPPFEPETLINYEIGTKMVFQGGKGHLDAAIFYSDYKDYQGGGLIFDQNSGGYLGVTSNFGDVTIRGVDLSASVAAADSLTFYVNGAYTDAEIAKYSSPDPNNNLARPGDPVDYVPEISYTLGGEYRFAWLRDAFLQVDYNYRDKVPIVARSLTLNPPIYSDEIKLLNARFGFAMDRWFIQIFGENLTNENGSFSPWTSFAQDTRNRPRTYGLKIGIDFE